MIKPTTGWFEIVKVLTSDINELTGVNDEYIDKSSCRVSHLFNPLKVVFDNRSEFKWDFVPLLKDFNIESVLTKIKNPQANVLVDQVHQVLLNIIVTRYFANRIFDYINSSGNTLAYTASTIMIFYYLTIQATPGLDIIGRDVIFNLESFVDWIVITAGKNQ